MIVGVKASLVIFFVISLAPAWLVGEQRKISFNRDIRPILSDKCFQCHGPDEETLEANLRLDHRDSAVTGEKGAAIVPGDIDASELIYRLTTDDDLDLMPPEKIKKPISKQEIELLKQWIREGAEYEDHWSFQAIEKNDPPVVKSSSWAKNEIDQFVLSQLEEQGIAPSPEADPHALIRRLYIDLVGLLPPPERVASFVSNYDLGPVEKEAAIFGLIDELLESPHYGERWGRHWLDQARYADSNGYTIDGERTMWPYRDWVIRSVNEDLPFDQFTIQQLAGDLLENPTKAQLVASGFHRNTLINQEGGTDDEQFRNEEVVDRVNTTGAVWLGLTMGCAQCHTHKFDPISHREYFEMFAFFNQGKDVNNVGATIDVAEGEMLSRNVDPAKFAIYETAKKAVASLEASKGKRQAVWEKEVLAKGKEEKKDSPAPEWKSLLPKDFSAIKAELKQLEDHSILAKQGAPKEVYTVTLPLSGEPIAAIRLRLLTDDSLPKKGPGLAGNGNIVLTRVEFRQGGELISVAKAFEDHAQPGFSASFTIDDNPETGWATNVGKGTLAGMKMNAPHEAQYVFEKPVLPEAGPIEVVLRHEKNNNYNIGRFAFDSSKIVPKRTSPDPILTILRKKADKRSKDEKKTLVAEFARLDAELRKAREKLAGAQKAIGYGKGGENYGDGRFAGPTSGNLHSHKR